MKMNYNVVIVDDDELVLFLHSKIIEVVGLHQSPRTFNTAIKALEFFETLPNDTMPILLFLDINMPVMDGWGLLDIIHKNDFGKKIEVIMVTSSVDQRDKDRAASYSKIIDFVEKPFSKANLLALKTIVI
jgi:CheY-like chemotaxis protein